MPDSNIITIYATDWCWDCRRARRFFDQHAIPYRWVNIDHDPKAESFVKQVNRGMRSVPTIVFPDGSTLVEPSNQQLSNKLNISTQLESPLAGEHSQNPTSTGETRWQRKS
jgi:mycoredoxin